MQLESMYQEIILDHYRNPHHKGLRDPHDAEVYHVNPTCGDEVTMRVALKDVGDNFTRKTGTKIAVTYGGAGKIRIDVEKGEPADVVILPKPDIAALATADKIAADSVHDITRTELSIAVRKGQPKPDISSLAGVKEALLAARTIAYYSAAAGGADGILAEYDFARLGIANEVAAKAKLWKSVQEVIAEKSADLLEIGRAHV